MRGIRNNKNGSKAMDFQELLTGLARAHGLKAALSLIGAFLIVHLLPIAHFIVIGSLLVACDWFTGVWASITRNEKITSQGLRRTVRKIVFYSLGIVLVLVVESTFFRTYYLVTTVALYISMVELYSNLENIGIITGRNITGVFRSTLYKNAPWLKNIMENNGKSGDPPVS